jgi:endonuclease/exonuclease/phosphatase family metal-dependent hydrolase
MGTRELATAAALAIALAVPGDGGMWGDDAARSALSSETGALSVSPLPAVTKAASSTHHSGADERPDVVREDIRVMSFNIHHGADDEDELDLPAIASDIRASGADVIGLQEVDRHMSSRSDFADQAAWLAHRLGMYFVYGANLDRPPKAGQSKRRQYGTAVLSKHKIVGARNHVLRNILYARDPSEPRGLLEAVIDLGQVQLSFFTTHLDHQRGEQRRQQMRQVAAIAGASRKPVVLVGDLNTAPGTSEMRRITAKFTDSFLKRGRGKGYSFRSDRPTKRIDYILVRGSVQVRATKVIDSQSSDHRPIIADLTLEMPGPGAGAATLGPPPVWFWPAVRPGPCNG